MRNAFALLVAAVAVVAFGLGLSGPDRSHERHMARIAAQERALQMGLAASRTESAQPVIDDAARQEAARGAYLSSERTRAEREGEGEQWRDWRDMQDVAIRRTETYERRFAPRVVIETAPQQQDFERELERIRKERDDYARAAAREDRIRYGD
jgi:hypothetical protein